MSPREAASPHPPHIQNLYVTIDTCANLGGVPYKILEDLKQLYAHTKARKITMVDTEQGFHEKANATTPATLQAVGGKRTGYGHFVLKHPEWTKIVRTQTCAEFHQRLTQEAVPMMVLPLVESAEIFTKKIQRRVFSRLPSPKEWDGKPIESFKKIPIEITAPSSKEHSNYRFVDRRVETAADGLVADWKKALQHHSMLIPRSRFHTKDGMAQILKATQELKGYTHMMLAQSRPEIAEQMGATPVQFEYNVKTDIASVTSASAAYQHMKLPVAEKLVGLPEFIQALRLCDLWPWKLKNEMKDEGRAVLKKIHFNTADRSYLDLFANHLPTLCNPQESLYILVTHDGPLMNEFLECTTGIQHSKQQFPSTQKGEGGKKQDVFRESDVHRRLKLNADRSIYPQEAIWVGGEFAEFAYKEAIFALQPALPKGLGAQWREMAESGEALQRHELKTKMMAEIQQNPRISRALKKCIIPLLNDAAALDQVLGRNKKQGQNLEEGSYGEHKKFVQTSLGGRHSPAGASSKSR